MTDRERRFAERWRTLDKERDAAWRALSAARAKLTQGFAAVYAGDASKNPTMADCEKEEKCNDAYKAVEGRIDRFLEAYRRHHPAPPD